VVTALKSLGRQVARISAPIKGCFGGLAGRADMAGTDRKGRAMYVSESSPIETAISRFWPHPVEASKS